MDKDKAGGGCTTGEKRLRKMEKTRGSRSFGERKTDGGWLPLS